MTQAKILGGKCVAHFPCPRIQGMAVNARLYSDRADFLPKMLLGIAYDLLCDVIR
jgi:hypothetical protein